MDNIKTVPLVKLQEYVIRPKKELIPIALFLGGVDLDRTKTLWNYFSALKESEVPNVTKASKISRESIDLDHTCGLHHFLNPQSIKSFASRIFTAKRPQDKRLIEYIWWMTGGDLFQMQQIKEYNPRSRRSWRGGKFRMIYDKQPFLKSNEPMPPSFYPFITDEPQKEHGLLLAVHNAVPSTIPELQREDICQDLIVAILDGKIKKNNLKDEVPQFIKNIYKQFPTKYGDRYLDEDLPTKDGGDGFTLLDTLHENNIIQSW